MANPNFNLALPQLPQQLPQQQPQYAAPVFSPNQPLPQVPGIPADGFKGSTEMNALLMPIGVGGSVGYRAPRGLENVRAKLGITKSGRAVGSSVRRTSTRVRYDQYGNQIRTRSRSGASVGSSRTPAAFGIWSAVKSSVIIGGVISALTNGYALFKGQQTGAQAGANVAGDLVSSAVGGAAGAVASWMGCGMLASMGLAGGMLTVAGLGLGIAGYYVADKILRNTTLFQQFQHGVYAMLGGK